MFALHRIFSKRWFWISIIAVAMLGFVYFILRLTIFPSDPIIPLLNSIYKIYLIVPEWIANLLFSITNAGVVVSDHQLVFENVAQYHISYSEFLDNWPRFLLYKRFSSLVLVAIWITSTSYRKKILFSILFIFTHIVSVVGGLYLLGAILPGIIDDQTSFFVTPTLVGTLTMYILLAGWILFVRKDIQRMPLKFGINLIISNRRIYEVLTLLFFYLVLRYYMIPFMAFERYVVFLLEVTRWVSSFFAYYGYVDGVELVGEYGVLGLSKHCLGFITMYLFTSMIYLTRPLRNIRITWIYVFSGLAFLFVLNLLRLILVFIVAQGENGYERASLHHEVYNITIYIFIFILWVVWFEIIRRKNIKEVKETK